jgi:putative cardiolipin synthase
VEIMKRSELVGGIGEPMTPAIMAAFARFLERLGLLWLLAVAAGCATLPPPIEKPYVEAVPIAPETELGRVAAQCDPGGGQSAFRPLPLSAFSMDARLTLVRASQRTLDVQYYLLQNDVTGHTLTRALRDAAGRGVRVRLLVDDLYTADNDEMLVRFAAHPNVEVRLFNPFPAGRAFAITRWLFSIGDFSRVNHRMHNKLLIADGAFAVAGGRNMADEYFFSSKSGNFIDFDLLITGEAVPKLAKVFDRYWNSPRIYPLGEIEHSGLPPEQLRAEFEKLTADARTAYPTPAADKADLLGYRPVSADLSRPPLDLLKGRIEVFADDPEKVSGRSESGTDPGTVTSIVGAAMSQAKSELVVGSPYFIPGKLGMDGLAIARKNGVRVDVITNSLASNDEPLASAAYGRYRVGMLKLGVNLYETDTAQLRNDALIGQALGSTVGRSHSKLIIIDRRTTFVGSMNLDFRSSRVNTELGMLVDSPELAEKVLSLAERVKTVGSYRLRLDGSGDHVQWISTFNGTEAVLDDEPGVSLGTRLQLLLLSPFISESLL